MEKAMQFLNSRGNKLDTLLYLGSKDQLIVLCHGFGGCKDDFGIKQLALSLHNYGFSTFIFDFTGQGKSEGEKDFNLAQQVSDLELIIDHFKDKYSSIVVIGGSMGGLVTTLNTIKNSNIAKLILVNPFLYLFKKISWQDTKYLIGTIFLYPFNKRVRSIYSCYFSYFQPKKLKVPTLIIVGKKDSRVSPKNSLQFYNEITCRKTLIKDDEIDHELSKQEYVEVTAKYINNWLKTKK